MHISKPCHESFAGMLPLGDKRHCQVCSTAVVDFTSMNTAEIEAYFKAQAGQPICGRFKAEQVSSDQFSNRFLRSLKKGVEKHIRLTPFRLVLLSVISAMFTLTGCIMGKRAEPEAVRKYYEGADSMQVQPRTDSTTIKH